MINNEVQVLINLKSEIKAKLKLIPYDGTPEIKENNSGKYIYIRKRVAGKLTSTYVDKYSDELFKTLQRYNLERKELNKQLRKVNKELALLGYKENEISSKTLLNIDFARANLKLNIYNQAILEGVATTFPDTETIIENGEVTGMKAEDVLKILNLKHAWEFILDEDVLCSPCDLNLLSYIAKLVNEGIYTSGGRVRTLPVLIGGSNYVPPIPVEQDVKEEINNIINSDSSIIDKAINLCLYCMKTQIFLDGNKRASVIFANYFLIKNGVGLLVIPWKLVPEFKKLLVSYYEGQDEEIIKNFLKAKCWMKI